MGQAFTDRSCLRLSGHRSRPGHHGLSLWGAGGLAWVLATAAAYLIAGIAAFSLLERAARNRGTLGTY